MELPARLTVFTQPVAKARPRVTTRGGKARTFTPRATEEAEWRIRTEWTATHGTTPATGPLAIEVLAFVPMPKSIPRSRRESALPTTRPDADNYLKTVMDALNEVAYRDDAQLVDVRCTKLYAVDGPPCWVIKLDEAMP
jgi:Holliday junction resolvase RusA-like endonuclease